MIREPLIHLKCFRCGLTGLGVRRRDLGNTAEIRAVAKLATEHGWRHGYRIWPDLPVVSCPEHIVELVLLDPIRPEHWPKGENQ